MITLFSLLVSTVSLRLGPCLPSYSWSVWCVCISVCLCRDLNVTYFDTHTHAHIQAFYANVCVSVHNDNTVWCLMLPSAKPHSLYVARPLSLSAGKECLRCRWRYKTASPPSRITRVLISCVLPGFISSCSVISAAEFLQWEACEGSCDYTVYCKDVQGQKWFRKGCTCTHLYLFRDTHGRESGCANEADGTPGLI